MSVLKPRPWRRTAVRALLLCAVTVIVVAIVADVLFPPPLEQFLRARSAQVVLAKDGSVLRAFADPRGIWSYPIDPKKVSGNYLQALLNYEDRWFYRHPGVNPAALVRASWQALAHRQTISGGSTLSMQVARIIEPIERSLPGKAKQIWRAVQLERRLSKSELLAIYLKHAPFGGNIEGVQTAAMAYLGKSAEQLSDAEAALLVVLPQRPSRLRPDRHAELAQLARNKVLRRMGQLGVWDRARVADALLESVAARRLRNPQLAPLLAEKLRASAPENPLIHSGIDPNLQQMAQVRAQVAVKRFAPSTSIAILIVDNQTMLARAYVGSAQFADRQSFGHIDMVQALRSPGSTLKPSLYAMALDQGLIHSESLMVDAPQDFNGFRPGNFAEDFNGPISVAAALRLSLNIPAVDLIDRVGPGNFHAALRHAGLDLQLPPGAKPNLSMILGGAGATLEQLVSVHAALARKGLAARVRYLHDAQLQNRRLMSAGAAWITYQMLAEANNGGESELYSAAASRKIAYKTGTSFGFRDAWALGASQGVTIGVWIGRPDGTPNPGSFGAVSALPLLFDVFGGVPQEFLGAPIARPDTVSEIEICWPLGTAFDASDPELCHRKHRAYVLDETVPPTLPARGQSLWQSGIQTVLVNSRTGRRRNASCLDQHTVTRRYARWPALLYPWLSAGTLALASPPTLEPGCTQEPASERLVIEGILHDSQIRPASNRLAAQTELGLRAIGSTLDVRWLLDGKLLGQSVAGAQFKLALPSPGKHRMVALDGEGRYAAIEFRVLN